MANCNVFIFCTGNVAIKTSFVTIDVSDMGKQIRYMAGNNVFWVGIYRPAFDMCDEGDVETLFSNIISNR